MSSENAVKKACNCHVSPQAPSTHCSRQVLFLASGSATASAYGDLQFFAYLFVKFDIYGFELLLDVATDGLELGMGKGLACSVLFRLEVACWGLRHRIERYVGVLGVSNAIEFYV